MNVTAKMKKGSAGKLHVMRMDPARGKLGQCKNVDAIITSPPYANRLDYSRMWAPETHVLACLFKDIDIEEIKSKQVGSIVVRGKSFSAEDISVLPKCVQEPLRKIYADPSRYSMNYYFPFFMDYAKGITKAMNHMASRLAIGGIIVIFVRDTVRKNVMFPTRELIAETLERSGCSHVNTEDKVIDRHIGFVRKASAQGLYGHAQREWWLIYRRGY